jgi:hypothetical protein
MGITECCKNQANGDRQRQSSCVKVSVIVAEGHGLRISTIDNEILHWNGGAPKKKKLQEFPHVFYI